MLEPVHCGPLSRAPLLPKLRGHFAEFLNNASSVGLRILSSPTCVGLRYGYMSDYSGFSRHMAHTLRYFISLRFTSLGWLPVLPGSPLLRLRAAFLSAPVLSTCVPTVLLPCSTGISTCCPSATARALALGPDLPREDQLYPGNLGYSAERIPTSLSLLIPAFSSLLGSLHGSFRYRFAAPPMLLYQCFNTFPSFGVVFQPRTFSAQDLSTSELLRTL